MTGRGSGLNVRCARPRTLSRSASGIPDERVNVAHWVGRAVVATSCREWHGACIVPSGMDTPPRTRLERVRALYRFSAPLYDAFRRFWSRLTRSSEVVLDDLFAKRIRGGARILELGPGTGINLGRLRRLGIDFASYIGVDASEAMLARARERFGGDPRIDLRLGDVNDLSGVAGTFDFVVSTWMLSHLEDPVSVVRAATRRLAPGGSAVFLFSGTPRSRLLRWCLRAFYWKSLARFVDPEPLRSISGLETIERRSGGLATLVVFRAAPPA